MRNPLIRAIVICSVVLGVIANSYMLLAIEPRWLYAFVLQLIGVCLFADYLLGKVPAAMKNKVADVYNAALKKFSEENADFLAAVGDLTAEECIRFDRETPMPTGIFCQSVGSLLPKASGGQFPLNFSHHLVRYFDGANDGLVSEQSFAWGEKHTLLTTTKSRGISHGDVIDLNRQNIDGFDVREFYVTLVNDLKNRGL